MGLFHAIVKTGAKLAPRGWIGDRRATRSNPVGGLLSDRSRQLFGVGDDWTPSSYGDYLAVSPTVYSCINLRARNLARVRLRVFQRSSSGIAPVEDSHPLQRLFDRPNPFWGRQRFWYMVEASLGLWGSAPIAIFKNGLGEVRELWWLHPSRFKVVPDPSHYIKGYIYTKDGAEIAFAPDEVLWFRYPNPIEEYAALSPIAALRMSIDMNADAIRFNRRFFQNDATPGRVYMQSSLELTSAQAEELRLRWERAYKGPNRAHSIAILDKSAELKTLALSQREMEFVQAQRFTKEEICGAYGVSPMLIGDLERSTFSNFQQAKANFWEEAMVPEMENLEAEVNESLIPLLAGDRFFVRFDMSTISALREDASSKARRYGQLVASGILTINEVREREGLAPVPWGDQWQR